MLKLIVFLFIIFGCGRPSPRVLGTKVPVCLKGTGEKCQENNDPQNEDVITKPNPEIGDQPSQDEENMTPGIEPPDPPEEENSFKLFDFIVQAEQRKGMEEGFPVYLKTEEHSDEFKVFYGNDEKVYKVYTDLWTIKSLQESIELLLPLGVVGIRHIGSYNYRVISGTATPSRHSYGLAFDISGFYLADGSFLSIKDDWKDATKGVKLKQFREILCRKWHVVLSPDYNADHNDHLHIDLYPKERAKYEYAEPKWDDLTPASANLLLYENEGDQEEGVGVLHHGPIDYQTLQEELIFAKQFSLDAVDARGTCK